MKSRFFKIFVLFILLIITFISYRVYISMTEQMVLLSEFNSNQFNTKYSVIDSFNDQIPNISVTTIPLSQMKAQYLVKKGSYKDAASLVYRSLNTNKYLGFSDFMLTKIHEGLKNKDSAKYYSVKAVEKLPNNGAHIANFYKNIGNDFELADLMFEKYKNNFVSVFWLGYLNFIINDSSKSKKNLIELAEFSINNFPDQKENFQKILNYLEYGIVSNDYQSLVKEALEYFNQGEFKVAKIKFEEAIKLKPEDYSNYENLSIVNFNLKEYDQALKNINYVIEKFKTSDGKAEMIKGLSLIFKNERYLACEFFKISLDKGFKDSSKYIEDYCNKL